MRRSARTISQAFALAIALVVLTFAASARAELQVDGRWRQGPLREEFTVQQWLSGCGPAPQNGSSGGGEIIAIRAEGDELAFVGGGRVYRTNQCYDPMPNLQRETHTRDPNGKSWRTRCTTPANDPRKTILNTLVMATTSTRIDIVETGRYEIVLESGRCVADVKRTRSFDLIQDEKPAPAASTAAPAATQTERPPPPERTGGCEAPGAPRRLEVRPSKKLLRTGESFRFRALVLDEKGCATRTTTTWKLAPGSPSGVTVDASGNVIVAENAPSGTLEIIATAADKDTRVTVEVTSPAAYDELLARSGLNAAGEDDEAAVVSIATTSIGVGEGEVEDRAKTRRWTFIAIVGGVLLLLAILAFALRRRSRHAEAMQRKLEERHEDKVREVLARRRAREEEHAAQQRAHEASLAARAAATAAAVAPSPTQPGPEPPKRGKICPTCGDRFDGSADFCGKDGTQLVLLN